MLFEEVIAGNLMPEGPVSELSSSGLLLSSVSLPLLPRLQPPLSISLGAEAFLGIKCATDDVEDDVAVFFIATLCSAFNDFSAGLRKVLFGCWLSLLLMDFSPCLDNDELDEDDKDDDVDDKPTLEPNNA